MSHSEIMPPDEETAALPTAQLLAHLSDTSYYLRGRAIAGLGKRLREAPEVFAALLAAAQNPANRQTPFFGFIMVAWLSVITVLENGSAEQKAALKAVVQRWPPQEQEDLRAYLADTDLPVAEVLP